MKKELIYLSLADFFNKNLYINYNQKFNLDNHLNLRFTLHNAKNLGNALKAISILESIYPRKTFVLRYKILSTKVFQKKNSKLLFNFDLNLTGVEFIEMYRFFSRTPTKFNNLFNIENLPLVNRKLKNFESQMKLKFVPTKLNQSFNFIQNYHLN